MPGERVRLEVPWNLLQLVVMLLACSWTVGPEPFARVICAMRRRPPKRHEGPEHPRTDGSGSGESATAERFEDFYESEHDRLYRALYLLTGRSHEAEELMQEAFVRVWERWALRGSPDDPVAYLYRTAMNAFRMGYRRAQLSIRRLASPGLPRDRFGEVEVAEDLKRAMEGLTRRQREAIVLTAFLGYEPAEAATILKIRSSTVRALTTQARSVMRDRLGGQP